MCLIMLLCLERFSLPCGIMDIVFIKCFGLCESKQEFIKTRHRF